MIRVLFTAHTGEDRSTGRAGMDGVSVQTQALQAIAVLVTGERISTPTVAKLLRCDKKICRVAICFLSM
jgi:hypothetical protein